MGRKKESKQVNHPRITVDMGCYNFEKYITEAIESVLSQTLQPHELIITDDCSTDKSWEIIQEYAKNHPHLIHAFRMPHNVGMKQCGKFRKERAKGELISSIDGDDRWLPRKLENGMESIAEESQSKNRLL